MPLNRRLVPALTLAIVALAAACGSSTTDTGSLAQDAEAGGTQVEFTAAQLAGGEFTSAELTGKDTVLWFWAPWCTTCRAEAPEVVAAVAGSDGQVEVVGIAGRGGVGEMEDFVSDTDTGGLRHVIDESGDIWSSFGVVTQPSYAFVNDTGEIEVVVGALGEKALSERMAALAES